jgi:type IV secretion system protein VirD4
MQLTPDEELVLVSGLAPIRAKKLRYFSDPNFKPRVLHAPVLATGPYEDRPTARVDGWADLVRTSDARLRITDDAEGGESDGGMEQQRHPGLPEQPVGTADIAEPGSQQLIPDEDDFAADARAMDQAKGLSAVARGYGMNEGAERDLVPGA